MTESGFVTLAVVLSFLLFVLPFSAMPKAVAQESTIQKIAQPISRIGDVVIAVAERLFAMPVDLMGYVIGLTIGFMERYSYNMVTRSALALVAEIAVVFFISPVLSLLLTAVITLLFCVLLPLVAVIANPVMAVFFLLSLLLIGVLLAECLLMLVIAVILGILVFPPALLLIGIGFLSIPFWPLLFGLLITVASFFLAFVRIFAFVLVVVFLMPAVLSFSIAVLGSPLLVVALVWVAVDATLILAFLAIPCLFVVVWIVLFLLLLVVIGMFPVNYCFSGFRPAFRTFSSRLYSCLSLMNGIAARFSVVALLWSEFYDGLLRGSSISPFVRNFFQIAARGFYLEKTPLV